MSKNYAMTGFRIGILHGSKEFIALATKLQEPYVSCGVGFSQMAAVDALNGDQGIVSMMRDHYMKRRDIAVEVLK